MRVLVTRPEPDGERTAAQLRARGCDGDAGAAAAHGAGRRRSRRRPWDAVALTSANAVRALAGHPRLKNLLAHSGLCGRRPHRRCGARARASPTSSPPTATRAISCGLIAAHLRGGAPLLYLAGEDRAGDLAGELAGGRHRGRRRSWSIAPSRPRRFPPTVRDALAAGRIDGVLHFSRRSAEAYLACAAAAGTPRQGAGARALLPVAAGGRAACRPPAPAAVRVAERPTEADLIDLVAA